MYLQLSELVPEYTLNRNWLETVIEDATQVFEDIQIITGMAEKFEDFGYNEKSLEEILPDLQDFLFENEPYMIFDK